VWCAKCHREYDRVTLKQRPNLYWELARDGSFTKIVRKPLYQLIREDDEARRAEELTRDEYFAQDILVRIDRARAMLEDARADPIVFEDDGIDITVADVLHDAYIEIKRLRGASSTM
jgi:hypothetical protein